MILGTHNSMTYLKSSCILMRLFQFIARCQSLPINKQYEKGVRAFDIRIYFDKHNIPVFKHGQMYYKFKNVFEIFDFLNKKKDCYIRLILEQDSFDDDKTDKFIEFCKKLEMKYTDIIFFGGNRKFDWETVYRFKTDVELEYLQFVSSTNDKWIDDIYPKHYAKKNNKEYYSKYKDSEMICYFDFIELI